MEVGNVEAKDDDDDTFVEEVEETGKADGSEVAKEAEAEDPVDALELLE